ncbi:MAG: hypothetical protein HBSAPP03_10310 [Phycisphaerae bacterium]|nr:MAG: hypothetical protein HBSAPP03_10310 [Phycisphaerae bacterium]
MSQTKLISIVAGMAVTGVAFAGNDAELRADAAGRTSALAPAAGYNNGFFEIGDGANNTLRFGGTTTWRWNMSFRDDEAVGDQNDYTHGFNAPVQRLRVHGTIWDKALSYKIQGNFSDENPGGGVFALEEAWGAYDLENGVTIRWGQQSLGLHRAQLVDQEFQQGMGRSLAYLAFSSGYVQGVQVHYSADMFRLIAGFHDGIGSQNSDFNSGAEMDYALNLRVEVQAMGNDWNRWNDFTSFKSAADNGLLIGAGINWQSGGETGGTPDVDALDYTVDFAFEGQGFNIFFAGYGQHIDAGGGGDADNFGLELGGGFFFSDQVEGFARWDWIIPDDDVFGDDSDCHFITAGVNYYMSPDSHAVKFTVQAAYALNETDVIFDNFISSNTRTGFLGQDEDGEITFSAQGQVMW